MQIRILLQLCVTFKFLISSHHFDSRDQKQVTKICLSRGTSGIPHVVLSHLVVRSTSIRVTYISWIHHSANFKLSTECCHILQGCKVDMLIFFVILICKVLRKCPMLGLKCGHRVTKILYLYLRH